MLDAGSEALPTYPASSFVSSWVAARRVAGMRGMLRRAGVLAALCVVATGCTSTARTYPSDTEVISKVSPTEAPPAPPTDAALPRDGLPSTTTTIVRWVDGDTVVTSQGRVRLRGMDTPERGQCGFGPATSYAGKLAPPGATVELVAVPGDDDTDRYGRLLRYVYAGPTDVGYALIDAGYATARYDSRDGYGAHPHEDAYIAADARTSNPACPA
jgi:endonuclease YncB( thermonuclease family)